VTTKTTPRSRDERPANSRRAREAAREQARRRWIATGVVVAAVALFGGVAAMALGSGTSTSSATTTADGYRADKTAFDLPALTGTGHVRLADHLGRPVVVNFFASWCVYCNEELPGFVEVAKATKGEVDFIGVNTSETGDGAAMARRFSLSKSGFSLAKDIGSAPASDLWASYGTQGLPVTAFYDKTGKQVDFSPGMLTQTQLEERIKTDFGIDVKAADSATLAAPVIPVIPQGAYELLRNNASNPDFVVLDVRTPSEFSSGHVPEAANVDFEASDFAAQLSKLNKDKTYLVYCHTGSRSGQATALMNSMGFKHVYNVEGGITAWQAAGLPTTR
jgi:rhodanese-related sulfurtransferase/peroxiredoxin